MENEESRVPEGAMSLKELSAVLKISKESILAYCDKGMPFFLTDPNNENSHKKFFLGPVKEYLANLGE